MLQFDIACENHASVDEANSWKPEIARDLWDVLSSGKDVSDGSGLNMPVGEAILETMPEEYCALIQTDDIACAAAHAFIFPVVIQDYSSAFELRETLRTTWKNFARMVSDTTTIAEGFGWSRGLAWKNSRKVVAAGIDTSKVARIAKLAGRMYTAMRGGASSPMLNTPAEVCNVMQGSDVSRMIAGELGLLGCAGMLSDLQMMRIVTHKATIYQTKGTEKRAKGPLVLMVDESGSMHGHRQEWAAAACVALARVAADEHRAVSVVHFSDSVFEQELDAGNPADVIALIQSHFSGGTDIARAIRAGHRKAVSLRKRAKILADAILITDGIDYSADIPAAVEQLVVECRLWTVAIDQEIPENNPLRSLAAEYIHLTADKLTAEAAVPLGRAAMGDCK
jgi:hypothetical protein